MERDTGTSEERDTGTSEERDTGTGDDAAMDEPDAYVPMADGGWEGTDWPADGVCRFFAMWPGDMSCGNGVDDDGNGRTDCDDACCQYQARCRTTPACDPWGPPSCGDGRHCALTIDPDPFPNLPMPTCVDDGAGAIGEACTSPSDCSAGLTCVTDRRSSAAGYFDVGPGICLRLCANEGFTAATATDPACAAGELCLVVAQTDPEGYLMRSGYGVCATAP
jgi:hypothetical protein